MMKQEANLKEIKMKIKLWILKNSMERQNRILDTTEDIIRNSRKYIIYPESSKDKAWKLCK